MDTSIRPRPKARVVPVRRAGRLVWRVACPRGDAITYEAYTARKAMAWAERRMPA